MTILTIGTSANFLSCRFQRLKGQKPQKIGKIPNIRPFPVILEISRHRQSIPRRKLGLGNIFFANRIFHQTAV